MAESFRSETENQPQFGLDRAWRAIGLGWLISLGLALFIGAALSAVLSMLLLVASSAFFLTVLVMLLSAKGRVLNEKDVPLFGGITRLISWDPGEGVIFLKNKVVEYVKGEVNNKGGIRLISSLLGEELALRLPLQIQPLSIEDSGSSTKDGIPVIVRLTLSWKIVDLQQMYLTVGKELKLSSDVHSQTMTIGGDRTRKGTMEYWLVSLAKEKTRSILSRVNAGRLIFDNIVDGTEAEADGAPSVSGLAHSAGFQSSVEKLSADILEALSKPLAGHGIQVDAVTIEQITLPPEIYRAAAEAAASRYSEVTAVSAANSRKKMLQAEVEVLGVESVAFKEIAANMSGPAVQDILMEIIGNFHRGKVANASAAQGEITDLSGNSSQ